MPFRVVETEALSAKGLTLMPVGKFLANPAFASLQIAGIGKQPIGAFTLTQAAPTSTGVKFAGVNIGGNEFMNNGSLPNGQLSWLHATLPEGNQPYEINYLAGKNGGSLQTNGISATAVRLPGIWERLQQGGLNTTIDWTTSYAVNYLQMISWITGQGMVCLIDICHQYGVYPAAAYNDWPSNYTPQTPTYIGTTAVPISAFTQFWAQVVVKLTSLYGNSLIAYDLMNEPGGGGHAYTPSEWAGICNAAIAAMRNPSSVGVTGTGTTGLILVPMTGSDNGLLPDLVTLYKAITDSGNNFAMSWHQYVDQDNSGSSAIISPSPGGSTRGSVIVPGYGAELLMGIINTAREFGFKLWFGEFGWNSNADSNQPNPNQWSASGTNNTPNLGLQVGDYFWQYLNDNSDVVIGATQWTMGGLTSGNVNGIDPNFTNNVVPATGAEMHQVNGSSTAGTKGAEQFWKGGTQPTAAPVPIPVFQITWLASTTFGTVAGNPWLTAGYGNAAGSSSINNDSGQIFAYDTFTIEGYTTLSGNPSVQVSWVGMANWFVMSANTNGQAIITYGNGNTGNSKTLTTTQSVVSTTPLHWAFVSTPNGVQLYINGTLVASGAAVGTNIQPGFPLNIGYYQGDSSQWTAHGGAVSTIMLSSTAKYTANFAPPAVLSFKGTEKGTILYAPLNDDGNCYI